MNILRKNKNIQAYQVVYFIRNNYIDNQSTVVGWSPTMLFFFPYKKVNFHKSLFSKSQKCYFKQFIYIAQIGKKNKDIKNSQSDTFKSSTSYV